jgi:RimJ/RimL family protein N-acetyltransferase
MHPIFLSGKIICLRPPVLPEDVYTGGWHTWFNDPRITEHLEHGVRPISAAEEIEIIDSGSKKSSNLIFAITRTSDQKLIGTISLREINHIQRRAEIGLVLGHDNCPGAAIEAMALLTQHAFDRLNLEKLYAGQHEDLWKWVNTLATIGYSIEGFRDSYGYRNGKPYGVILTGVTASHFFALRDRRCGDILMGDAVKTAMNRSKTNPIPALKAALASIGANSAHQSRDVT